MKNFLKTVNIILLVSCLVSAQIQIEIIPGANEKNPGVVVSGSDRAKATTIDMDAFHLTHDGVKENLGKMGWVRVGDLIINHASAYGYKDLYVVLKPKLAKIVRANDKIVKFSKKAFRNENMNMSPRIFRPELKQEVTETMTTKWHELKEISVGHDIKHIMGFNRIVHASAYGQEDFASRILSVNAETEDEVVLKSGQYIKAGLEVKETTLEVRIDYEVSLEGDIYFGFLCTFLIKYCPKHINLDVNDYFRLLDYPPVIKSNEIVTFTYYHDPQVNAGEVFSDDHMNQ